MIRKTRKKLTKVMAILLIIALAMGFTMPMAAAASMPFRDVPSGAWFHGYVAWAFGAGVTNGTTPTTFTPSSNITRGEMITFIHRALGSPTPAGSNPFTDVPQGRFFTNAAIWASEAGVTTGITPTTFGPNRDITRQEIITMIHRFMGSPAASQNALAGFADAGSVAAFAQNAMRWGAENEVIGRGSSLDARGTATRAQALAMLYRAINLDAPLTATPDALGNKVFTLDMDYDDFYTLHKPGTGYLSTGYDYSASPGSTIITIYASFLAELPTNVAFNISAIFEVDGDRVVATLQVVGQPDASVVPPGDDPADNDPIVVPAPTMHTVTLRVNDGSVDVSEHGVNVGGSFTLAIPTFTRHGYNLTSWNTAPDGSGDSFDPGHTFTNVRADITLYAQWTPLRRFAITFVSADPSRGAIGYAGTPLVSPVLEGTVIVAANIPVLVPESGYVFSHWSPNPLGHVVEDAITFTAYFVTVEAAANAAITAALNALEALLPVLEADVEQDDVNDLNVAEAHIEALIYDVINEHDDVDIGVSIYDFEAAVAGDSFNEDGYDGGFDFVITVTNPPYGRITNNTVEGSVVITAEPWVDPAAQVDFVITAPGAVTYGMDTPPTLVTTGGQGGGAITWSVVTGDSLEVNENTGALTIVSIGETTIRATIAAGGNFAEGTADLPITVLAAAQSGFAITAPGAVTFGMDTPPTLVTTGGQGGGVITWSVVTGDSLEVNENTGELTIVSIGETTIRATIAAGGNFAEGTADLPITVLAATPFMRVARAYTVAENAFLNSATEAVLGEVYTFESGGVALTGGWVWCAEENDPAITSVAVTDQFWAIFTPTGTGSENFGPMRAQLTVTVNP